MGDRAMTKSPPKRIDEAAARRQFESAIETHELGFETFFFAQLLKMEFDYLPHDAADAEKEACLVTFPMTDVVKNTQGALHGGAVAWAMDIAMGHLVNKVAGPGTTIEMKIQYMRPITEGTVTCEGRFVRRGRTLSFMEGRLSGPDGKLAALATATWKMP